MSRRPAGRAPRRVAAILTLVAAAPGVVAAPATARRAPPSSAGLFSISPGGHELTGRPPLVLSPTAVGNTTGTPLHVRVYPVLVHQRRDGSFTYSTRPAGLRAARRVLAVSTTGFAMAGHDRRTVLTRWRAHGRARSAYAGVLFRATSAPTGATVHTVEQLLGVDLLAAPGTAPAAGALTGLDVGDGTAHRLRLEISLRNVGGTFGTPRSIDLTVRSATGRTAAHVAVTPGVILPRVTRDFAAELPAQLAPGRYTATATARLGARRSSRTISFRVVPGGLLPAPSLVPGTVGARGEVGHPAHVTVALHNQGTRTGAPEGTVSLYRVTDGVPAHTAVATAPLTAAALAPGTRETAAVDVGRLRAGHYQAVVRYRSPVTDAQPGVVDFAAQPATSWWASARHFVAGHVLVLCMGAALAAGLTRAARRGRGERRRREGRGGIELRPLP